MKIDKRTLGLPIAEGGEGQIYIGKTTGDVLKVFKPGAYLDAKRNKLEILLHTKLPTTVVAPKDLLYNYAGDFIGYVMPNLHEIEEFRALTSRKTLAAYNIHIIDILHMLVSVRDTILELHPQNIFIGDLNDANVVFTGGLDARILDVDSWSIGSYPCVVAMDSFKDPKLKGTNFNANTDAYSFAILAFKSLTRLHPFGGTVSPNMDLLERMSKGRSVLNPKVKAIIPRIIDPWEYMYPGFLEDLSRIYDQGVRIMLVKSLDEFAENLTRCQAHGNDYYAKYDKCPVCFKATLKPIQPQKVPTTAGIIMTKIFASRDRVELLNDNSYIDSNGYVCHIKTAAQALIHFGEKTYFYDDGTKLTTNTDNIFLGSATIPKLHNSNVIIKPADKQFFYVSPNLTLHKCNIVGAAGVSPQVLAHVAINHVYSVASDSYCVINFYDHKTIIETDKNFIELADIIRPTSYGLHYDDITKRWLFIYESTTGKFVTYVIEKTNVLFKNDALRYNVPLDSLAFHSNTIYTAHTDLVRGYNWKKNEYKDFNCIGTEEGAMLMFKGKKIIIINQKEIYEAG